MTIGEIGAGRGRMTVYFAREVGAEGKVYANDIDELSLSYLRGRCRRLGFTNVEIIAGKTDDPLLPEKSLDMAVMVLVYHMIEKPDMLLENIKRSLKPGASLVIIDPVDAEIDREFGIDRSKPDVKTLTIRERIAVSAKNSGYQLTKVDTTLQSDIIFTLKPSPAKLKVPAGETLVSMILNNNIKSTRKEFERMKKDTLKYDLSEMEFRKAGYEFIGSRSYPEAEAILEMGIEIYPNSAMLFAEMGEAYLMYGNKEKSLESWKRAAALDPENHNGKYLLENFDMVYEQIHPKKK
jgi:ubiquinone/menaquinone biosynthesis C-methylase UbiE